MDPTFSREVYLQVLEKTVDNARKDLSRGVANDNKSILQSLDNLRERWRDRFTLTNDFTDDPNIRTPSRGGNRAQEKKKMKDRITGSTSSQRGTELIDGVLNDEDVTPVVPLSLKLPSSDPNKRLSDAFPDDMRPPTKRARAHSPPSPSTDAKPDAANQTFDDEEEPIITKEELDSDDSDSEPDDNDESSDSRVIGVCEKIKKGNKWKVTLRDVFANINQREYLFDKAICVLDNPWD